MRQSDPLRLTFLLSMMTLATGALRAQTGYNPGVLPMGDKEALMANTGTGGIASTGAVFYNPAALTLLEGDNFSLSGSAYMRFSFSATPVARLDATNIDFEGHGYQSVPTSMIMARSFGKWRLAFSFLVPMQFKYEGQKDWQLDLYGLPTQLKMLQNYSEGLFAGGISAARKLDDRWSIGLSLFGNYYSYLSFNDLRLSVTTAPEYTSLNTVREMGNPISLQAIAGVHWRGDKLGLGLRVLTPNLRLGGKGEYYEYAYANFGGGVTTSLTDLTGLRADIGLPFDVRAGLVYDPDPRFRFALDLAYGAGRPYERLSGQGIHLKEQLDGFLRGSLGIERAIGEKRSVLAGVAYAPYTSSGDGRSATVNFVSWSLGFKMDTGLSETSIGFFQAGGSGDLPLEDTSLKATQKYGYLGLFLATNIKIGG